MTSRAGGRSDTDGKDPQAARGAPDGDEDGVRMVLWTRRPVCGPRADVIDRLSRLEADGSLADFTVETWPDEVVVSERHGDSRVLGRYEEFAQWAAERGVSVTPPFEQRTVLPLVGGSREILTVPMLCLAVYGDDLRGVYPCTDGERTWSVTDALDAYESADGIHDVDALPIG